MLMSSILDEYERSLDDTAKSKHVHIKLDVKLNES